METQYEFLEILGTGGFGEVRRARKLDDGKEYAIKIIDLAKWNTPMQQAWFGKEWFKKEFLLQQECASEYVIKCFEISCNSTHLYARLELGDTDLRKIINECIENGQILHLKKTVSYINNICQAIAEIHRRNIIHRDIKPSNIMIKNDVAKIGDFGFATKRDDCDNEQCGTRGYAAPEVYNYSRYNYKIDIWGMGCICYELMTNAMAFPLGNDLQRRMEKEQFKLPRRPVFSTQQETNAYVKLKTFVCSCLKANFYDRSDDFKCLKDIAECMNIIISPSTCN